MSYIRLNARGGPEAAPLRNDVGTWDLPARVEMGIKGATIHAYFPELDGPVSSGEGAILDRLLAIARHSTAELRAEALAAWTLRFGLLNLPWDTKRSSHRKDGYFVRVASVEPYLELSRVLTSTLRIHEAVRRQDRITDADVTQVMAFTSRALVPEAARLARAAAGVSPLAIWSRSNEPLPSEHTARNGDIRRAWRELQAERVKEVFNILVRSADVRLMLSATNTVIWTGGAIAGVAAALHASIVSAAPFGVCGFCGALIFGRQKAPRRTYGGRSVVICCADSSCRKARQARYTRASRANAGR